MGKKELKLILILLSVVLAVQYGLMEFDWGLMDDKSFLIQLNKKTLFENIIKYTLDDIHQRGCFRPLYPLYAFTFYDIFRNHPGLFYFFKYLLLVLFFLLIYQMGACLFQDQRYSFFVLLAGSCFTPLTNHLVYLSIQESLGMFFGLLSFKYILQSLKGKRITSKYFWAVIFGLLALLCKATFISLFVTYAIWFFAIYCWKSDNTKLWASGFSMLVAGLYYIFVQQIITGYCSRYDFRNFFTGFYSFKTNVLLLFFFTAIVISFRIRKSLFLNHGFEGYVLFPLFGICYILVMFPWGIHTYLYFPVFVSFAFSGGLILSYAEIQNWRLWVKGQYLIVLTMFCFSLIVISYRLQRAANITEVREVYSLLKRFSPETRFFCTPFMQEASQALELENRNHADSPAILHRFSDLKSRKPVFLVCRDEAPLETVQHDADLTIERIYGNVYWQIYLVIRSESYE